MKTLVFDDVTTGERIVASCHRLLIAGFTGRDSTAVREHIDELAEIGVPVPPTVPSLYRPSAHLARQTAVVPVASANSSGEVEPVVFQHDGKRYLTVGSDHTDRDIETIDIAESKGTCAKPIGTTCIALEQIDEWDQLELRSSQDGTDYQAGAADSLLPIDDLLTAISALGGEVVDGDVLFCGTIPTIGPIRPGARFDGAISGPGWSLTLGYDVLDVSARRDAPMDKPELEFTDVSEFAFAQVPGGPPGLTERILAADSATGIATRMLHLAPGTDTSEAGVLRHDFWEEVYIVRGELHDVTLDAVFPAGTYACRPPGMPHGPFRSEPGCLTFEVRYPAS